jgi:hypothetical protein
MTLRAAHRRTRLAGLQTPVLHYQHPVTRHRIVLVCTVHIGEPAYFAELFALIRDERRHRALVHYEALRKPSPEEMATATAEELAALRALAMVTSRRQVGIFARCLGLVHQSARGALRPRPQWINTDVTRLELVRLLGAGVDPTGMGGFDELPDILNELPARYSAVVVALLRWLIILGPRVSRFAQLPGAHRSSRRWLREDALVDVRNDVAVRAALAAPRSRPLVMIWGLGHGPGIGRALISQGYLLTSTTWHTAVRWRPTAPPCGR